MISKTYDAMMLGDKTRQCLTMRRVTNDRSFLPIVDGMIYAWHARAGPLADGTLCAISMIYTKCTTCKTEATRKGILFAKCKTPARGFYSILAWILQSIAHKISNFQLSKIFYITL